MRCFRILLLVSTIILFVFGLSTAENKKSTDESKTEGVKSEKKTEEKISSKKGKAEVKPEVVKEPFKITSRESVNRAEEEIEEIDRKAKQLKWYQFIAKRRLAHKRRKAEERLRKSKREVSVTEDTFFISVRFKSHPLLIFLHPLSLLLWILIVLNSVRLSLFNKGIVWKEHIYSPKKAR